MWSQLCVEAPTIQWMQPRPDLHCRHCRDLNRSLLALSRRLVSIVANNSAPRRRLTIPFNGGIATTKMSTRFRLFYLRRLWREDVQASIIMLIFLIDGGGWNSKVRVFFLEREREIRFWKMERCGGAMLNFNIRTRKKFSKWEREKMKISISDEGGGIRKWKWKFSSG